MNGNVRRCDSACVSAPAECISRFVCDEVRPFLLRNREAALQGLTAWLVGQDQHDKELGAWQDKRNQWRGTTQNCQTPLPTHLGLAAPAGDLHKEPEPPGVKYPLPPPINRDLSTDECWAALVAVHDIARVKNEQITPADIFLTGDGISMVILYERANRLTEAHLAALQRMLASLSESQTGSAQKSVPAQASPIPPANESDSGFYPLTSWNDIFASLNKAHGETRWKNNDSFRTKLKSLNNKFDGPIRMPGRGRQPYVDEAALLEWFRGLQEQFARGVDEKRQEADSTKATTSDTYPYGATGTVVPGIAGHVEGKRKKGPENEKVGKDRKDRKR